MQVDYRDIKDSICMSILYMILVLCFSESSIISKHAVDDVVCIDTDDSSPSNNTLTIFDESLLDTFIIPPYSKVEFSSKQYFKGNLSISFLTDFYLFSKNDPKKNFTIDKRYYHDLTFQVYPTQAQQDLSVSLITSAKSEHSIPITNPLHPINSIIKSAYLPPNQWTQIVIPLSFFPVFDYRGIWFLQKHPNSSIYIDDIHLTKRSQVVRHFKVYDDGISGVGVLVHDVDGIRLDQSKETYHDHNSSIQFDISNGVNLFIEFQNNFKSIDYDIKLNFHMFVEKSFYDTGLLLSFLPVLPLEVVPTFNFTHEGNDIKKGHWKKFSVPVPRSNFKGINFKSMNATLTDPTVIYLDNIFLEFPVINSTATTTTTAATPLPANYYYPYFPFNQINFAYISSEPSEFFNWRPGFPGISFKTSNRLVSATTANLTYGMDFNNTNITKALNSTEPVLVLFEKMRKENEFQFINLNFSAPTNQFFLMVGSLDNDEDVWVSATTLEGKVTKKWNIISTGFLFDGLNSTNFIKYKLSNQGFILFFLSLCLNQNDLQVSLKNKRKEMNRLLSSILQRSSKQKPISLSNNINYNNYSNGTTLNALVPTTTKTNSVFLNHLSLYSYNIINQDRLKLNSTTSNSNSIVKSFYSSGVNNQDQINADAFKLIGEINRLTLLDQFDEALVLCEKVLQTRNAYLVSALLVKAKIFLMYHKDTDKAMYEINTAYQVVNMNNPERVNARLLRSAGNAAARCSDYQLVVRFLTLLSEQYPSEFTAIDSIYLGTAYFHLNDYQKALERINFGLSNCLPSEYKTDPQTFYTALKIKTSPLMPKSPPQENIETLKILFDMKQECLTAYGIALNYSELGQLENAYEYVKLFFKYWNDQSVVQLDQAKKDSFLLNMFIIKGEMLKVKDLPVAEADMILADTQRILDTYKNDEFDRHLLGVYSPVLSFYVSRLPKHYDVDIKLVMDSLSPEEQKDLRQTFPIDVKHPELLKGFNQINRISKSIQRIIREYLENNQFKSVYLDHVVKLFKCMEVVSGSRMLAMDSQQAVLRDIINFYNRTIHSIGIVQSILTVKWFPKHQPFCDIAWENKTFPTTAEQLADVFEDLFFKMDTLPVAISQVDQRLISPNAKSIDFALMAYLLIADATKLDINGAWASIRQAINLDRFDNDFERKMVHLVRGYLYVNTFQYYEGLDRMRSLYQQYPDFNPIKSQYIKTLLVNGEVQEAKSILLDIINNNNNNNDNNQLIINSLNWLGLIETRAGNGRSAIDYYNSIYSRGLDVPTSTASSNYKTRRGIFEAQLSIMVKDLEEILAVHPKLVKPRYLLSLIAITMGDNSLGHRHLLKAKEVKESTKEVSENPALQGIFELLEPLLKLTANSMDLIGVPRSMRENLEDFSNSLKEITNSDKYQDLTKSSYYNDQILLLKQSLMVEEQMAKYDPAAILKK
ncbi:hypothetical protein PPL_00646 [Heterostelium album PN500]|uniref:Uncharacterized protein n=1 Tax=Heterostelium pallidum (strain ATCC 26659 / Pp 5 / PN500) TaxID=670386 RepID=D3AX18_HETP5|nr:hypothetical protein PPL_00646 [Heterostelium album PN500]EFA86841.1 hypothetical protein PPL_00646 [Heterostelium album PN500]|eukprot:XP_020438944.1 hypothetical protein PPL_00646 [Heterostelium album PN500]